MTPGSPQPAVALTAAIDECLPRACGPSLFVPAAQMLASETAMTRFLGQLAELVGEHPHTALRVGGLGPTHDAPANWARICERVAAALRGAGADVSGLELTLAASALTPQTAWAIRREALGDGVLNLVLDAASMRARRADDLWLELWQLRDTQVATAFWPTVASPCALLSSEAAGDVVPGIGLQAPARSAWVACDLPLAHFCDARGEPDCTRLETFAEDTLRGADEAHECVRWPTAAMRHDAWLNRRVAVMLTGIGELAERAGLDPSAHASLVTLGGTLAQVRDILVRTSRRLAAERDMLPAIGCTDPTRRLPQGVHRSHWRRRWRDAAARSRTGHRNLLVMSPWSIFPGAGADYRYADLLPLLRCADACAFGGRPALAEWRASDYVDFHRRAWALSRASVPPLAVAERL